MTQFYSFNPEKKGKSKGELYFKMGLFAVFAAVIFILGINVIALVIETLIKYYLWVLGIIVLFMFAKKFFRRKKIIKVQDDRIER